MINSINLIIDQYNSTQDENHLEMSIEGFNNSYSEDFGKDFILTVNVDAYPLPKFTW